jgi:muconolactone delta-isomerase
MNEYMVVIDFPRQIGTEFMALIPQQRARADELLNTGVITSYILSLDRSKLWVTMNAESDEDVARIVDTFPLRKFMRADILPIAFHHTGPRAFQQLSMN